MACGALNTVHTQYLQRVQQYGVRIIQHTVHIMIIHIPGDETTCDRCLGSTQNGAVRAVTRNEKPSLMYKVR